MRSKFYIFLISIRSKPEYSCVISVMCDGSHIRKCVHRYKIDHDDIDGETGGEQHGCASANWSRSRRCTVLPLTSTDVAGEVVMSSMSCVLLFSAVVYLSLASFSLSLSLFFNICLRSRVQTRSPFSVPHPTRTFLRSFPFVGRTTFRARMGIESPPETPTPPAGVHLYSRTSRRTSNDDCVTRCTEQADLHSASSHIGNPTVHRMR